MKHKTGYQKGFPPLLVALLTVVPAFSIGLSLGLVFGNLIIFFASGVALLFCFLGIYHVVTEYGQEMYREGKRNAQREQTLF